MTFFEVFNVPVFWPILVMYFIMLFVITMKRQLKHMMKHKYVPWTSGKKKFQGKDDKGAVRSFMISNDHTRSLRVSTISEIY